MYLLSRFVYLSLAILCAGVHFVESNQPESTRILFRNLAGFPVEIFWKSPPMGELVTQLSTPLRNNSDHSLNSYEGHEFVIRNSKIKSVQTSIVHGEFDAIVYITFKDSALAAAREDVSTKASEVIRDDIHKCMLGKRSISSSADEMTCLPTDIEDCVMSSFNRQLRESYHTIYQEKRLRESMSISLRNYTCDDENAVTSPAVANFEFPWTFHKVVDEDFAPKLIRKNLKVSQLADLPRFRLFVVEDFITPRECQLIKKYSNGKLQPATINSADGKSIVSTARRANQTSYDVVDDDDPLADLKHRIFNFTNRFSNFRFLITEEGQEGFTVIQYSIGDEYLPHCDGQCFGEPMKLGGRVATLVNYCEIGQAGGGTTFSRANIFIRPKKYSAAFWTYGNNDLLADDGMSEHSGCPIKKNGGEKWIVTQWMRYGVGIGREWTKFDPAGNPHSGYEGI